MFCLKTGWSTSASCAVVGVLKSWLTCSFIISSPYPLCVSVWPCFEATCSCPKSKLQLQVWSKIWVYIKRQSFIYWQMEAFLQHISFNTSDKSNTLVVLYLWWHGTSRNNKNVTLCTHTVSASEIESYMIVNIIFMQQSKTMKTNTSTSKSTFFPPFFYCHAVYISSVMVTVL